MNKYTMKVYPQGLGRNVYRVIEIYGKDMLTDLADAILESFDFIDEHLYEFCVDAELYSEHNYQREPQDRFDRSAKIAIDKLKLTKGKKFIFHYDFGDDWMFVINVQKIEEGEKYTSPVVIKAKGDVEQYPDWDEEEYEEE